MNDKNKSNDYAKVASKSQIVSVRLVSSQSVIDEKINPRKLANIFYSLDLNITFKFLAGGALKAYVKFILNGSEKKNSQKGFLTIEAKFELEYALEKSAKFSKGALESFCKINAVFNAWPYWREYAQSQTTRMGITPLVMPLYKIPSSKK